MKHTSQMPESREDASLKGSTTHFSILIPTIKCESCHNLQNAGDVMDRT